LDQLFNIIRTRPASEQTTILRDESKTVLKENSYVVIYSRRRYVVQDKVLVLCIWYLAELISDWNFRPARQKYP